ncbi:MAG: sialate O-acetylesterase [Bryobacterales bacterium]|nr:sialate O-acetylesterase [Bryobacterales bacterium]
MKFSLLLFLPALLFSQRLEISDGAVDNQVFQRDNEGIASLNLSGAAQGLNGRALEVRATGKHGVLPGKDWSAAGKIAANKWTAKIDLPTGGPYRIEVRSNNIVQSVNNILIGDLWVLAGQSNMEGVGDLVNVEPPNGLIHSFNQSDEWVLAEEPLHLLPGAADKVHWRKNKEGQPERYEGQRLLDFIANRKKGAGLGLPFAAEMVRYTGVPIGIVPCAHGGTSMDQWNPALKEQGGDSLYGATIRRINLLGGKVRGILWYQGESDAGAKSAPVFQDKFEKLIEAFRADTGQPDLPFYYVQIGRFINNNNPNEWNSVQQSQLAAESKLKRAGMAPAVDLDLDDLIHVGTQDLKRLGRRLAKLACYENFPRNSGCPQLFRGPRPATAKFSGNILRVAFHSVNGKLVSTGRISGFSIHDSSGTMLPAIFKAEVNPASPNEVLLHLIAPPPEGATLRYGAGKDPSCNVRDQADMAVPVFGPMPIER